MLKELIKTQPNIMSLFIAHLDFIDISEHLIEETNDDGISYKTCGLACRTSSSLNPNSRHEELMNLGCPDVDNICPYNAGKSIPVNSSLSVYTIPTC